MKRTPRWRLPTIDLCFIDYPLLRVPSTNTTKTTKKTHQVSGRPQTLSPTCRRPTISRSPATVPRCPPPIRNTSRRALLILHCSLKTFRPSTLRGYLPLDPRRLPRTTASSQTATSTRTCNLSTRRRPTRCPTRRTFFPTTTSRTTRAQSMGRARVTTCRAGDRSGQERRSFRRSTMEVTSLHGSFRLRPRCIRPFPTRSATSPTGGAALLPFPCTRRSLATPHRRDRSTSREGSATRAPAATSTTQRLLS